MAESDPPTFEPATDPTTAQAEFARYKAQPAGAGATPGAPFASPLPASAVPAWSLQPAHAAPTTSGHGPAWGSAPSSGTGYGSIVEGMGSTIRLGVEVLNAALSNSIAMLNAAGGWGRDSYAYGYGGGGGCGGECGYDCCAVLGAGCACCEPSVGSCC